MAGPFNIVAQLQLQAPTNLQAVVGQIRSALTGISATVNLNINANVAQVLQQLNAQLVALQGNLQNAQSQANAAGQAVANAGGNAAQAGQQVAQANAQLASTIPSLKAITAATQQASTAMENFGMQAGLAARRYTAFLIAGGAIVGFVNSLRQGFEEALRFDREMVRLGQIGGTTAEDIRGLSTEISRLATTWGASSRELAQASVQLRQAGLSANDTKIALEALAKSSLSPSFGSMTDTTEGLISAMNQFKLSTSDAEKTLDAINAVSTRYAVSSQDLIDSIRRTGGAFHAAGGNLNELIALFGAVRSTSRESAESIGSSLRTIFVRMQRAPVIENLRHLGIELRYTREEAAKMGSVNLENQFVGPYEALRRLSTALKNIRSTDPRYSALTEELGGYRQISKIIPLMQEFGKAQDIYNTAQQGANSTTKSAEQAQAAFLVKIGKVREEFQALIRTITESKGFHVFLDMVIQLTSSLTKLASVLTPLIPLFTVLATFKVAQGMGRMATGFMSGLSGQSPRFATGGVVPGVGDGDTVPAMLAPGEFVIRKQAAQSIGYGTLAKMNKYAGGGLTRTQKKKAYVFDLDETLIAPNPEDEEQIAALKAEGKHGAAFMMGYADPQVVRRSRRSNLLNFAQRAKGDRFIMTARSGTPELNEAIAELGPWSGIITVGSMDLKVPGKRAGTMRKATTAEKKQYALRDLLGRGYDQVVFMDDNAENIAAAAAVEGVKALTAKTSRTGFRKGGTVNPNTIQLRDTQTLGQLAFAESKDDISSKDSQFSLNKLDSTSLFKRSLLEYAGGHFYEKVATPQKTSMTNARVANRLYIEEVKKQYGKPPSELKPAEKKQAEKAKRGLMQKAAGLVKADKAAYIKHMNSIIDKFDAVATVTNMTLTNKEALTNEKHPHYNDIWQPVEYAVENAVRVVSSQKMPKSPLKDHGFTDTVGGYLLEGIISGYTQEVAQAGQAPIDFRKLSDPGLQKLRNAIEIPKGVTPPNNIDAKRSFKPRPEIIKKGINAGLFNAAPILKEIGDFTTNKGVQLQTSKSIIGRRRDMASNVTALDDITENIVADASRQQPRNLGGIVQRFTEGGKPKPLPEKIERHTWDYTEPEYGEKPYLTLSSEEMTRINRGEMSLEEFQQTPGYLAMPNIKGPKASAALVRRNIARQPVPKTGTGIMQAPTGGDSLFIITYGKAGEIGPKVGTLKVSSINDKAIAHHLTQKGIDTVTGPVTVYGISEHARDEFVTEFEQPINQAVQGVFKQKFAGRAGANADFSLSKQQTSSVMGHMFEKYITGLFGVPSPGGNEYFDYTNGFNKEAGPGLNRLLYPNGPVTQTLGDAKLTYRSEDVHDIFRKWLNYRQGQRGYYAKGGEVDTVPALLTPGEFVINKQSAQRIGYNALEQMNRTGIAKFATGGPVRMKDGGEPTGNWSGTATINLNNLEEFAKKAGLDSAALDELNKELRNVVPNFERMDEALVKFDNNGAAVLGKVVRPAPGSSPIDRFAGNETMNPSELSTQEQVWAERYKRRRRGRFAISDQTAAEAAVRTVSPPKSEEPKVHVLVRPPAPPPVDPEVQRASMKYRANVYADIAKAGGIYGQHKGGQLSAEGVDAIRGKQLNTLAAELLKAKEDELKEQKKVTSALERRRIAEVEVTEILTKVLTEEQAEATVEGEVVAATQLELAAKMKSAAAAAKAATGQAAAGAGSPKEGGMMKGMGTMLFGMGTQYLASYAEKQAGTAEEAVSSGDSTAGYTTGKTVAGAAQMAGMGASLGLAIAPVLGPLGVFAPAVGAAAGAAVGAVQSFLGCSKELEEAKVKIQQADMGKALDEAIKKGTGTKDVNVQKEIGVVKGWEKERAEKIEASRHGVGALLNTSDREQEEIERGINTDYDKRMEGKPEKYAQLYAQDMRTFTRQQLAKNPQMSQEQVESSFLKQNNTEMNTMLKRDYVKYRPQILAAGREVRPEIEAQQAERAQGNIGILVRDFESMTTALRTATSGLNELARATAVSEDLYKGSVSAMQVRNPAENMGEIGGPNPAGFMRGLQDIAAPFGERGQQLVATGQTADAVRRELIATLPTLAKEGRNRGDTDLGKSWTDRVGAALDKKGIKGQQRDSILESVRTQLNVAGQDFQKLGQNLQNDASGEVNRLMRPVQEPLQKNAEEMARQLQQAGQAFSNASARFQQQLMELGQMADQTAKVEQDALQIRRQGEAALTHTTGMAAFNVPLEEQQHAFRARQQRLAGDAGIVGEAAFDPNTLSTRRRGVQDEARNLQQRIDKGEFGGGALGPKADAWKGATDKLHELERVAAELGQAQENLTHINEASAGIQERLNVINKEQESRRSLTERWLTGDSQARSDMMRGNQLMHVAMNRGTLEGFTPKDAQLIIQYMKQSGGVREGNRTREDWLQALLSNAHGSPYEKAASASDQERAQYQNQKNAIADRAVQSSGNIREDAARQAGQQRDMANTAIAEIGPLLNANLKALDDSVKMLTEAMEEFRLHIFTPTPAPAAPHAAGGSIFRPHGTDIVPAMLTPGEYVVNRESAQANRKLLEHINHSRGAVYLARGGMSPDDYTTIGGESPEDIKQRAQNREDAPLRARTPTGVIPPRIVEPTGIMPERAQEPKYDANIFRPGMGESSKDFLARMNRPTVTVGEGAPKSMPEGDGVFATNMEDGRWHSLGDGHIRIRKDPLADVLAGTSKDIEMKHPERGATPEELRAGSVTMASRDSRSMTGLMDAGANVWDLTHDRGLQAQAIIGAARDSNIRDFSRASAAATVAAGLSKVHIGQVSPGMTDQLQWGESAKLRMALTGENLAKAGQKIETDMATDAFKKQFRRAPTDADELKHKFDFRGFFAKQQMRMGAGADNMAQPMTATPWVTDEKGVTVGKLVPGSNGFVITSPEIMNTVTNKLQKDDKTFNKANLLKLIRNKQGTWMGNHPNWKVSMLAEGGVVPGDGQTDSTPALLTAGEFVISAQAAKAIGYGTLHRFNQPGYYQGGGEVFNYDANGKVTPGGRVAANNTPAPAGDNFNQSVTRLQSAFTSFSSTVNNLIGAISKLPPSIALTGNHNVNVNINGGEVFNELKGTIANMISQHVTAAINNFVGQRFGGEVPKITAAEAPKPVDVPTGT